MRNRLRILAIACGLLAVVSSPAYVSQRLPLVPPDDLEVSWFLDRRPSPKYPDTIFNSKTKSIRYYLGADAWSEENRTQELDAIRMAFDQWASIPNTGVRFEEAGLLDRPLDMDLSDGKNLVYWETNSFLISDGTVNIRNLEAVAQAAYGYDGSLQEADIVFNGIQYSWFTDINDTLTARRFVEGVALHEIGHLLGLDHSPAGGATLYPFGETGVNARLGFSEDEIRFAQFRYPAEDIETQGATLKGTVSKEGGSVLGAVVVVENAQGNLVSATLTESDGTYSLPGLPPGDYQARFCPLDSVNASSYLLKGREIAHRFTNADTEFLAGENTPFTLEENQQLSLDFEAAAGTPPFRISRIRNVSDFSGLPHKSLRTVTQIQRNQSGLFTGVMGPDLPSSGATLEITGDGLSVGDPVFYPRAVGNLDVIVVPLEVSAEATPGLRSFILRHEGQRAYANGFLEVLPDVTDSNFDGLSDDFQRHYFPVFTSPEAAPDQDPDEDGYSNTREFTDDTDPTDALSFFFEIDAITLDEMGTTVTWSSGIGKRYQVWRRPLVSGAPWETVGDPVTATEVVSQFLDSASRAEMQFYRIERLP